MFVSSLFSNTQVVNQTVKDQVIRLLTSQQKKVMAVAFAVLAASFATYLIYRSFIKGKFKRQEEVFTDSFFVKAAGDLSTQGIEALAKENPQFGKLLERPKSLTLFLENFADLPSSKRFELALKCGKELTRLDLSGFKEFNDEKLQRLKAACPSLESLNLSDTSIQSLSHLPIALKELILKGCRQLSTNEFEKLNASFAKLEILNVSGTSIAKLDTLPRILKDLNLFDCEDVPAQEFDRLDASFSNLEKLDISYTHIAKLDTLPRSLKELDLYACEEVPAQEFDKLDASFSNLEKLDVRFTHIAKLKILLNLKIHLVNIKF